MGQERILRDASDAIAAGMCPTMGLKALLKRVECFCIRELEIEVRAALHDNIDISLIRRFAECDDVIITVVCSNCVSGWNK